MEKQLKFSVKTLDMRIETRESLARLRSLPFISGLVPLDLGSEEHLYQLDERPGVEEYFRRQPELKVWYDNLPWDKGPDYYDDHWGGGGGYSGPPRMLMTNPLRSRRDYSAVGRKTFLVEQLPEEPRSRDFTDILDLAKKAKAREFGLSERAKATKTASLPTRLAKDLSELGDIILANWIRKHHAH